MSEHAMSVEQTHREIIARALDPEAFAELVESLPPVTTPYTAEQLQVIWKVRKGRALKKADSLLADIDKRGLCIVPKEPDGAMWALGERAWMNRNPSDPKSEPIRDCYRAMVKAAPK